ncbi:MAG: GDP-L-fucose synthase family protein [Dehalococcoidia bacterium]
MSAFWQDKRVLVTGASGFLGRHLVEVLAEKGCQPITPTHKEYDLVEQAEVGRLLADFRPQMVFHLAALVGGIWTNQRRPGEFFYNNAMMTTMVMHEAWRAGVAKLVTCIGGCSYPATAAVPIREESLWEGYPQAESAPYALAKRMAVVQAQAYRDQYGFNAVVLVPGNMYGSYDNFNLEEAHVIPALVRRFHEAKEKDAPWVVVWGSGRPTRDFVYVRDVAEALAYAAEHYDGADIINISSGTEVSIQELAETIAWLVGYQGQIAWDATKPDGQMRKVFATQRMERLLGFRATTPLEEGLRTTIGWFQENYALARL